VVGRRLELPGVAVSENASVRRRALRVRRVGVREEKSLACDAVERRRLNPLRSGSAGMNAPVIGNGKENVGGGPATVVSEAPLTAPRIRVRQVGRVLMRFMMPMEPDSTLFGEHSAPGRRLATHVSELIATGRTRVSGSWRQQRTG